MDWKCLACLGVQGHTRADGRVELPGLRVDISTGRLGDQEHRPVLLRRHNATVAVLPVVPPGFDCVVFLDGVAQLGGLLLLEEALVRLVELFVVEAPVFIELAPGERWGRYCEGGGDDPCGGGFHGESLSN